MMFHQRPKGFVGRLVTKLRDTFTDKRKQMPAIAAIAGVLVLAIVVSGLSRADQGGLEFANPFDGSGFVNKAAPPAAIDPHAPPTTAPPPPVGPSGALKLLFSDEFGGDGLDTSRWARCYPHGTVGCTNKGNNELEWYRPENVSVANGSLRLTAQRQQITGEDQRSYDYTSGMVTTGPESTSPEGESKFRFQYGYVEARMKVPAGQGIWPAFWMLPSDLHWPPEIDIMEILGHQPNRVHLNNHWSGQSGTPEKQQASFDGPNYSADWHTFGVDWQPDSITWYVDGAERNRFEKPAQIPQEPMFVLLNLAVGGNWPGSPNETTPFPSTMEVDWVRIWGR